jgi:hypothetical protein
MREALTERVTAAEESDSERAGDPGADGHDVVHAPSGISVRQPYVNRLSRTNS